jgi:hypothetical protein
MILKSNQTPKLLLFSILNPQLCLDPGYFTHLNPILYIYGEDRGAGEFAPSVNYFLILLSGSAKFF